MRSMSRGRVLLTMVALLALVAAGCGDDDDDDEASTATTEASDTETTEGADGSESEPAATEAEGAGAAELVAAATEEGGCTIYSSQGLDALNAFAEAFESEYDGIDVEVVRGIDTELSSRVETEHETGGGADMFVSASQSWVEDHAEQGWFLEPVGPQLTGEGDYDADQYVHEGNHFEVGAAVLTFAWNTGAFEAGLESYEDLLDPGLSGGKIGVIEPAAPSIVDFYLWLEENFGEEYVEGLAAQEPRIYPSSLPMGEALIAGEIFAASFGAPAQLEPAKASGAPIDYAIDPVGAWGARYFGMLLDSGDNPNCAQLLGDFMVTAEGQELVVGVAASILPDIPGTLLTNEDVREQDLSKLTPEAVSAYQEKWNSLFR